MILKSATRYSSKIFKIIITILVLILLLPWADGSVSAQSTEDNAVYIVQSGDTINIIAIRFGVSPADLISVNNLENPDFLVVGSKLIIPGLKGVSGILATEVAPLGASLLSLTRQFGVPVEVLTKLNRVTSPAEIYVGSTIILPTLDGNPQLLQTTTINAYETLLEKSIGIGLNPWSAVLLSGENTTWSFVPGEPIAYSTTDEDGEEKYLSISIPHFRTINISPLPLVQGKTIVIQIETDQPAIVSGMLDEHPLNFFSSGNDQYTAIQGIHALAEVGLTNLSIDASFADDTHSGFDQSILLEYGYYLQDPPLNVDPQTIDPNITRPEDELVYSITSKATAEKYWSGVFLQPVDDPICIYSWFGNRRSYNGSPYDYFHTGVDYGVCANLNIYSPANGIVVYTGELTVRGYSTIINHGWGIYSGFWHQNKILVEVGDTVSAGDLIGEIGGTGRVTGPHLHWEIWANGVQVEPFDWLDNEYP